MKPSKKAAKRVTHATPTTRDGMLRAIYERAMNTGDLNAAFLAAREIGNVA